MSEIAHPHDALFKALLERPETAGALLRERLSPQLAAQLAPEPPEMLEGGFVDEALRASHSDVLYRARLSDGGEVFIYCVIEHKSSPDPLVGLQLLGYVVNAWKRVQREFGGAGGALPPLTTLVVYHGREPWNVPLRLQESVARPYIASEVPDLGYGSPTWGRFPMTNSPRTPSSRRDCSRSSTRPEGRCSS